jgi:hypothetical protein
MYETILFAFGLVTAYSVATATVVATVAVLVGSVA